MRGLDVISFYDVKKSNFIQNVTYMMTKHVEKIHVFTVIKTTTYYDDIFPA